MISQARISMPAVDIGIAQLAMHSANECFAIVDYEAMQTALTAFYSSSITIDGDKVTIE